MFYGTSTNNFQFAILYTSRSKFFLQALWIDRGFLDLEAIWRLCDKASKIPGRNSNQNKGHLENTPSFGEMIRICGRVLSSGSFWEVSKITPEKTYQRHDGCFTLLGDVYMGDI